MEKSVSKSRFKARALEYFRFVEKTGKPVVVTDRGKPRIKISLYEPLVDDVREQLKGTVLLYVDPLEPVGLEEWEAVS
jgi:hypothetical protein